MRNKSLVNEMQKLVRLAVIASLLLGASTAAFSGDPGSQDEADWIFEWPTLHTLDLKFDPEAFLRMRDQVDRGWTLATAVFDDMTYEEVGVKSGSHRFSKYGVDLYYSHPNLRVDFGYFRPGQTLFGLKIINIKGHCCDDDTLIAQPLGTHIANQFGIPGSRYSFLRLTVNDEFIGAYFFDQRMEYEIAHLFPGPMGNLYEVVSTAGYEGPPWGDDFELDPADPDNPDRYIPYAFRPMWITNPDGLDIVALVRAVNQPAAQVRAALSRVLDIDNLIDYLIFDNEMGNNDGLIAVEGTNYYQNKVFLYHNPRDDRFVIIPWDLDSVFNAIPETPTVNRDLLDGWDQFVITKWMLQDRATMDQVYTRARAFLNQIFVPDNVIRQIDEIAALVRPSVYEDLSRKVDPPLRVTPASWEAKINTYKQFVRDRAANLRRQLER